MPEELFDITLRHYEFAVQQMASKGYTKSEIMDFLVLGITSCDVGFDRTWKSSQLNKIFRLIEENGHEKKNADS